MDIIFGKTPYGTTKLVRGVPKCAVGKHECFVSLRCTSSTAMLPDKSANHFATEDMYICKTYTHIYGGAQVGITPKHLRMVDASQDHTQKSANPSPCPLAR